MCNCGGCPDCLSEQHAVIYLNKQEKLKMPKPKHAEDIFADCPNCGNEVKAVRYDDDDFATGTCLECSTDFTIDLKGDE
jgi:hypothetical protein